ncbi:MAG: NAD(P)-binding protein [Rhodospirillaceae bacterium]|nr:NAD(P)-binding protein [Rhodospirillaceae bacterium]
MVIAGGGLAGAAAACLLARAGRAVCVIERERSAKHKVCGEFLSYEAQHYLSELGLDLAKLGAIPIDRVRLLHRKHAIGADLPFRGMSLSRHVLDEALLELATSHGAEVIRGHVIREIDLTGEMRLVVDEIGEVRPEALFLACGKHEIRGAGRRSSARPNDLIGLKTYLRLAPDQVDALREQVEIILFRGGYAGLQMVEGDLANLCLLMRRKRFDEAGQDWMSLIASLKLETLQLRDRLMGAVEELERPLAISRIPFGFVHHPNNCDNSAFFRLGDQLAVTPSFTGDGMSIALHTAFAASEACLIGEAAEVYHRRMRAEIGPQVARAGILSAGMLHDVGQVAIMAVARVIPSLLRSAATVTRIPSISGRTLPTRLCTVAD